MQYIFILLSEDMALKRRLQKQNITPKIILGSDSDEQLSEGKGTSPCVTWTLTVTMRHNTDRLYLNSTFWACNPQPYRGPSRLRQNEASYIRTDCKSLTIFMLFFSEIMQLLVEKTYTYYHKYLDMLDIGHAPLPDMAIEEMYLFYL
jgi:hypothetical protein